MIFFVLDDEPLALRVSVKTIRKVIPEVQIVGFRSPEDVFSYIKKTGEIPDIVFSDIEMPGMNGIDFAFHLKMMCPDTAIIFVTAYSKYALEAFKLHVHGYILKPLTVDRVIDELKYILKDNDVDYQEHIINYKSDQKEKKADNTIGDLNQEKLEIRCFGYFEVFWKGVPLQFGRRQTKELFAYLIDRRGAMCTSEEIAAALWENEDNMKNLKARIRILISDLRHVLQSIGLESIIIRRSGQISIQQNAVNCDYYRMLIGDIDAVNAFRGEYMVQYSWAEMTVGQLIFDK